MELALLAEVTRGGQVESVHEGVVAVVNAHGALLYQAGNPRRPTFTRSALKPFQAVPLVASGGLEAFGFTRQQTALLCASHSGEPAHVEQVQAMLAQIGCRETDLCCGVHPPLCQPATAAGEAPRYSQLHNNCSGKHAGFLAYCKLHGHAIEHYLALDHPLQQAIRGSVARHCDVAASELVAGIDGCSAPNYAMPLSQLALGYARLAQGAPDAQDGASLAILRDAMIAQPQMVSGSGRFDLALMQAGGGDWVAKGGAEGVQAIGVRSAGLGIAIKVADGNARALYPATITILAQLGLLGEMQQTQLTAWMQPQLTNLRGIVTGEIRATVRLQQSGQEEKSVPR